MARRYLLIIIATGFIFMPATASASSRVEYESAELLLTLSARTPQQMAAFYEARGFSSKMIDRIKQYCFITVFVRNKTDRVIWHDLASWQFSTPGGAIQRIDRQQLKRLWQSMDIPLAHQSTFRWTLLPETLDFRPNEREGGNIVLPWPKQAVSIQASFKMATANASTPVSIKLKPITCQR